MTDTTAKPQAVIYFGKLRSCPKSGLTPYPCNEKDIIVWFDLLILLLSSRVEWEQLTYSNGFDHVSANVKAKQQHRK